MNKFTSENTVIIRGIGQNACMDLVIMHIGFTFLELFLLKIVIFLLLFFCKKLLL